MDERQDDPVEGCNVVRTDEKRRRCDVNVNVELRDGCAREGRLFVAVKRLVRRESEPCGVVLDGKTNTQKPTEWRFNSVTV